MEFANSVLKYRLPVFAAILAIIILSIPGFLKMDVTVEIADYFIEGDEAIEHQERFEEIFGKTNFIGVLFESEDVFSRKSLEKLHEIGDSIEQHIPWIEGIYSIAHLTYSELGQKGYDFNTEGILSSDPGDYEGTTSAIAGDPSLSGTLFSENRKEAWILVPLSFDGEEEHPDDFELGELVYNTISAIECDSEMSITAVGASVYAHRKKAEMMGDLNKIMILGAVIALILCIIIFRRWQAIVATLSLISFTPAIVFGALGWLGLSADSAFISVPILLTMGVSIGNVVHINHFFRLEFDKTGQRRASVVYAIGRTWRPILFTVITTITAMLSFTFIQVKPIVWVGLVSAASIFVLYVLCMLFVPIILSWGKDGEVQPETEDKKTVFELFFDIIAGYNIRYQTLLVVIFAGFTLAGFYGSSLVKIDFNAEKMMGTKLDHMKDQVKIKNSAIASNEFMDLTIEGNPGWFKDSAYICRLEDLQAEIDSLALVKRTTSVLQLTSKFNLLQNDGEVEHFLTPKKQAILDWLFYLIEDFNMDLLFKWVTEDYSSARILIEMSDFSSREIQDNIHKIDDLVSQYFPESKDHFLSGSTYQMALMNQYITKGLVKSIGISLVLITLLMMICFGNISLGLIAMFPNVFPVIICGAIVGFVKIPLEFVTMTVAPLILGLAVDDTIHFISSLKTNITKSKDFQIGLERAYREVGVAITKTTIILSVTFLVFTISDIRSTVNMGILTSAGLSAAYLADVFIVPILIKWIRPFGSKA
jgi:predicted RND superfamily exporter protein